MRPLAVAVALAGLAMAAAATLGLREQFVGDAPPPERLVQAQPEAAAPRPMPPVPERVRPVAPDFVPVPPVAQEGLERVEEREPLSPMGRAHVPSEGPPKATILYRPLALGAGLFQSQGHTVALAGIEPPDAKEECVTDGASWPCGVHARTAFRNWLRGRALTCVVPVVAGTETVVSDCTLGRQNPAEWLVGQGWARATAGGPYAELEAQAKAARRGLFGPAPAATAPAAITVPDLPAPEASGE